MIYIIMINLKSLYIINKSHDAYNVSKFMKNALINILVCDILFCATQVNNVVYMESVFIFGKNTFSYFCISM